MGKVDYVSNQLKADSYSLFEIMEQVNNSKTHLEIIYALSQVFYPKDRLLNTQLFLLPSEKNIAEKLKYALQVIIRKNQNPTLSRFASKLRLMDWELFNTLSRKTLDRIPITIDKGELDHYTNRNKYPFPNSDTFRSVTIFPLGSNVPSTTICIIFLFSSESPAPIDTKLLPLVFSHAEKRIDYLKTQANLKLISEIGFKLDGIDNIEQLLEFVLDETYHLRPYDFASAGLIDREDGSFELYEIRGMSRSQEQWFEENMSFKWQEYINWALDQDDRMRARIVNVNEEGFVPPLIPGQVKSFLNTPLVFEEELLGIITLANSNKPIFTLDDFKIYSIIIREAVGKLKTLTELKQHYKKIVEKPLETDSPIEEVDTLDLDYRFPQISTRNPTMRKVFKMVKKMADSSINILILGETGTGKEVLARAIHFNSQRKNSAFVPINCVALNEGLLESELFGHAKGAFTGAYKDKMGKMERANGGTLFLDELGDIPINIQAKLLRAIQEREIERVGSNELIKLDIRIVCATSRDLEREIARERFRKDLFFRLNAVMIELPPLRERYEDIPFLAEMFLDFHCKRHKSLLKRISQRALNQLMAYSWPGNLRELENVIQKSVIFSAGKTIPSIDLSLFDASQNRVENDLVIRQDLSFSELKEQMLIEMEEKYIIDILKRFRGNVAQACRYSKIDRKNFYNKMKKYGINHHQFKEIPAEKKYKPFWK